MSYTRLMRPRQFLNAASLAVVLTVVLTAGAAPGEGEPPKRSSFSGGFSGRFSGGFSGRFSGGFSRGDHIAIIGNSVPERLQHQGWLETLIYSRFPTEDLVFRTLAVAGDELTVRLRSEGFGSP